MKITKMLIAGSLALFLAGCGGTGGTGIPVIPTPSTVNWPTPVSVPVYPTPSPVTQPTPTATNPSQTVPPSVIPQFTPVPTAIPPVSPLPTASVPPATCPPGTPPPTPPTEDPTPVASLVIRYHTDDGNVYHSALCSLEEYNGLAHKYLYVPSDCNNIAWYGGYEAMEPGQYYIYALLNPFSERSPQRAFRLECVNENGYWEYFDIYGTDCVELNRFKLFYMRVTIEDPSERFEVRVASNGLQDFAIYETGIVSSLNDLPAVLDVTVENPGLVIPPPPPPPPIP